MLLNGKSLAKKYTEKTKAYVQKNNLTTKEVRIIFVGDNYGSRVYVAMKKRYAQKIGLTAKIAGQDDVPLATAHDMISYIQAANADDACVGVMVQLPLPEYLRNDQAQILGSITPIKDIDGLAGVQFGRAMIGLIDFLPATPLAIVTLLQEYGFGDVAGKCISILGQSNLIGKPLAAHLMGQGATVFSFNHLSDQNLMKQACLQSDYIISCTGKVHLIDTTFVRDDQTQVIVDVGRGKKDGIPAGDVDIKAIKDKVLAYTPVPGGVGPMTIASLFWNVCLLDQQKKEDRRWF